MQISKQVALMVNTKMSSTIYSRGAERRRIRVARYYHVPIACLVDGLEKHVIGQDFVASQGAIQAVRRFFVRAYDGGRIIGENNLPKLTGKYEKCVGRDPIFNLATAEKLRELYQKAMNKKIANKEVSFIAIKLLGILDNLEENPNLAKKDRKQYEPLLRFGRALLSDPETQEPHYYSRSDNDD